MKITVNLSLMLTTMVRQQQKNSPIGSEFSTAIKYSVSMLDNYLAVGTMPESLHTWLKDVFRNHSA